MSLEVLSELNWLAVLVGTVAYFALGGIWYAQAIFGKAWIKAGGIEMPEGQSPGPVFYVVPLIANFVATVATAMIAASTGSSTVGDGIILGLVVAIGYAGTLTLLSGVFDTQKPDAMTYSLIGWGYHLVGLVIVSVIVSVWE